LTNTLLGKKEKGNTRLQKPDAREKGREMETEKTSEGKHKMPTIEGGERTNKYNSVAPETERQKGFSRREKKNKKEGGKRKSSKRKRENHNCESRDNLVGEKKRQRDNEERV